MGKLILLAVLVMALVVLGLGVKIFFSKKKEFPNTHVGGNENMENLGISCASSEEDGMGMCSCQMKGHEKGHCHTD